MYSVEGILKKTARNLIKIKKEQPLVHHITNYVAANSQANITLSIGASPLMAEHPKEVKEILSLVNCLVINTGTITPGQLNLIIKCVGLAAEIGVSFVLDPVGVSCSKIRLNLVKEILNKYRPAVIKGNIAEIKTLAGKATTARGVDSLEEEGEIESIIKEFADNYDIITAVTGRVDYITDGETVISIENGSPLMKKVTGTGCMTGSLIAAFQSVETDPLLAAIGGVLTMALAGEKAASDNSGPGTLFTGLFDQVYWINERTIMNQSKLKIN